MNEAVAQRIEEIRGMGMIYSFDGFSVADFLVQLDKVVEVQAVHFGESRLRVKTGPLKQTEPGSVLALIPAAAMLNVAAAFMEPLDDGSELWFEWILPKDLSGLR